MIYQFWKVLFFLLFENEVYGFYGGFCRMRIEKNFFLTLHLVVVFFTLIITLKIGIANGKFSKKCAKKTEKYSTKIINPFDFVENVKVKLYNQKS